MSGQTERYKVIGECEVDENGEVVKLEREWFRQGYIYKNPDAYHNDKSAVCYVPELSDSLYTGQDFLDMCNGQPEIADQVFDAVDWQHPESYLDEQDDEELWICRCGKWYWCYGVDKCPHCGAKKEGEEKDMKEMILSEVIEAVKKMVGHEHEVMSHQVRKNNGVHLHAVIIKRPGEVVSPTIYVDKFIEMVEKEEMKVTEVAERVFEVYKQNKNFEIGVDVRDLADKEFVLGHVQYQLINKERNQDIVNTAPHKVLLDLAGIYRVVIRTDESETASYVLTDEMMKRAGIAIGELDEAAMRNTESSGFIVKTMAEIMAEMMGVPAEAINNSEDGPQMFVLTNQSKTNGANIMMCGKQLAALADRIDSDFYILPSSIHEVLAIPVSQIDHAHLKQMVQDVNDTQVEAEEILGYEVYRYDREAGELMIAE